MRMAANAQRQPRVLAHVPDPVRHVGKPRRQMCQLRIAIQLQQQQQIPLWPHRQWRPRLARQAAAVAQLASALMPHRSI